jgi:predicted amidophosphoribosyltransferase
MRIGDLGRLVAPPLCAICAAETASEQVLCGRCLRGLASGSSPAFTVPGADSAWAARAYEGAARELVAKLKFGGRLALAGLAAEAIDSSAPAGLLAGTLVPVPASPLRRAWRGFDPAEQIAVALARRRGLRLFRALRREPGPRQVGRTRRARIADPPRVHPARSAPPTAIVLDDVSTTGATLSACAAALRRAGAGRVVAIAFAATPADPSSSLGIEPGGA